MMGSLFYDPLANPPSIPAAMHGRGTLQADMQRSPDTPDEPSRRRTGPVADEKALRAASLRKVSRDLEHLMRKRPN
ncbi:MAG TPA: hypothetical protein VIQ52_08690 [Arthrobacter sp.]